MFKIVMWLMYLSLTQTKRQHIYNPANQTLVRSNLPVVLANT